MGRRLAKDWLQKLGATKEEVALGKKLVRAVVGDDAHGRGVVEDAYAFELHDVLRILMRERIWYQRTEVE